MSILSLLYGCQVWHLNDTNRSMHKISVAWNNCFRRIFYVAGGRVSNHYNIFAPHSQCRISFSSANCFFWKKRFTGQIIQYYWHFLALHTTLLSLLVVLSMCSHQSYQTMQSKDSYGTYLPRLCNCNWFCVYYFDVIYCIVLLCFYWLFDWLCSAAIWPNNKYIIYMIVCAILVRAAWHRAVKS